MLPLPKRVRGRGPTAGCLQAATTPAATPAACFSPTRRLQMYSPGAPDTTSGLSEHSAPAPNKRGPGTPLTPSDALNNHRKRAAKDWMEDLPTRPKLLRPSDVVAEHHGDAHVFTAPALDAAGVPIAVQQQIWCQARQLEQTQELLEFMRLEREFSV